MKTLNIALLALLANNNLIAKSGTKEGFKAVVAEIQKLENYKNPYAFAFSRDDEVEVLENGEYITKTAQCSMSDINYKKDVGQNLGSAAIMHLALVASGVKVHNGKSEAVYDITPEIVKNALDLFKAYIEEAEEDSKSHLNIQMLLDLEMIFKNPGDNMPGDIHGTTRNNYKIVFLFEDVKVESVQAAFLKLYALSIAKAELRTVNLDGIFPILTNVSWIDINGTRIPISLDYLRDNGRMLKLKGEYPVIAYTDKFPTLLQHIVLANNTRILDELKVRFGAQVAAGTTVMPGASYINFNAGTEGAVMVEGRISSSAIVGDGSDVGGGASILGVLSGTDGVPVSIGKNTLLGANSVTGTTIGNSCILDAGAVILPGTKISLSDEDIDKLKEINPDIKFSKLMKGSDFQKINGVHFRQLSAPSNKVNEILQSIEKLVKDENSENKSDEILDLIVQMQKLPNAGSVIAMRSTREVKLNADLH